MIDHFIPIRLGELIDLLCAEPDVPAADREPFRQFCRLLTAQTIFEYTRLLERIKAVYAPFDADSDTVSLVRWHSEERQKKVVELLEDFAVLMERADYQRLSSDEIERIVGERSAWGLLVDVDFRIFERLAIFVRGDTTERRPLRQIRKMFREADVDVPIYQRLVMVMKLRKHPRLSRRVDTEKIYIQIFKNIPQLDVNMLMPGARVRMTRLDRSKIGLPMLSGLGMALWNIATDIGDAILRLFTQPSAMLLWGLATGAIGYGTKSYFSYLSLRQRYNLNLTQVLYFQNLDTNAGVLYRVLDEAREQECRELLLTYYGLWRHGGDAGLGETTLRESIDRLLKRDAETDVQIEVDAALRKLDSLGLIEKTAAGHRSLSVQQAIPLLEARWSNSLKTESTVSDVSKKREAPEPNSVQIER
jgi:hypothetical protein